MSHTMNIEIELHDETVLKAACKRLGLECVSGKHRLFGSEEEGLGIKLKGWKYPIVVKKNGVVSMDNYNGKWGNIKELNKLKSYYGVEKAKLEARRKGYRYIEKTNIQENYLILEIML